MKSSEEVDIDIVDTIDGDEVKEAIEMGHRRQVLHGRED